MFVSTQKLQVNQENNESELLKLLKLENIKKEMNCLFDKYLN